MPVAFPEETEREREAKWLLSSSLIRHGAPKEAERRKDATGNPKALRPGDTGK